MSMRLLIKPRASGKTTGLIYASEATGYPIAVATKQSAEFVKQRAAELNCIIPNPVTFSELREHRVRGSHEYDNVLVDEVQNILEAALSEYLHCNVHCATLSDYLRERR